MNSMVSRLSVQNLIDSSEAGLVLAVPSGAYSGPVFLKEGITLVGMGPEDVILDGMGADCVVYGAPNSALVGFTIRNGRIGISNERRYMGIFDCRIVDFKECGIRIERCSSMIANNEIVGHTKSTGIDCQRSHPRVYNNAIIGNRVGLRAIADDPVPCVVSNFFVGNNTAIFVEKGSQIVLEGNGFEGNAKKVVGHAPEKSRSRFSPHVFGVSSEPGRNWACYRARMMREQDGCTLQLPATAPSSFWRSWDESIRVPYAAGRSVGVW